MCSSSDGSEALSGPATIFTRLKSKINGPYLRLHGIHLHSQSRVLFDGAGILCALMASSSLFRPKLPRRYRLRIPPQTCPFFACQALEPFQLLVTGCIRAKPPAEPCPHNRVIEVAAVGQDHDGDWSAAAIGGEDWQCHRFAERQAGGELFGAIAKRLFRFWAIDSPRSNRCWLVIHKNGEPGRPANFYSAYIER